jgi:hypothetical protein
MSLQSRFFNFLFLPDINQTLSVFRQKKHQKFPLKSEFEKTGSAVPRSFQIILLITISEIMYVPVPNYVIDGMYLKNRPSSNKIETF